MDAVLLATCFGSLEEVNFGPKPTKPSSAASCWCCAKFGPDVEGPAKPDAVALRPPVPRPPRLVKNAAGKLTGKPSNVIDKGVSALPIAVPMKITGSIRAM